MRFNNYTCRVIVMWPSCYPCGFHIPCFLLLITLLVEVPALDSLPSPHATHHRQEHKYLLSHVTPKFKEAVFLVAVVTSPATSYDRRSRLRRQWARNVALLQSEFPSAPSVVMKFALGVNGASEETAAAMQSEEEEWGDILLLHGVRDLDRDEDGWPWQVPEPLMTLTASKMTTLIYKRPGWHAGRVCYHRESVVQHSVGSGELQL